MLSEQQVAQYETDGFIKGGRVLNDEQVETLREELDRVIRDKDRAEVPQPVWLRNLASDENPIWQIVNISDASDGFRRLVYHPEITDEAARLTGAKELRLFHDQIQYKPAGIGGVNMWHQDNPCWPILDSPGQVTAWVALDEVDESNGCMSMVPGSHRWGDRISFLRTLKQFEDLPQEFEGREVRVVRCPVQKGEVHYHHCLTWHGSHANLSQRPRRAIALHYMTEQTRYRDGGNHPMKPFVQVAEGEKLAGERFPLVWPR